MAARKRKKLYYYAGGKRVMLEPADDLVAVDEARLAEKLPDLLASEPALASYHLLPSVRGDLLSKLGRLDEARAEFERAASLTRNERERSLLLARASACVHC